MLFSQQAKLVKSVRGFQYLCNPPKRHDSQNPIGRAELLTAEQVGSRNGPVDARDGAD